MATYDAFRKVISLPAGSALTSHQWSIVTFNSSEQVTVATDADDEAYPLFGVLENKPADTGAEALICTRGKSKVKAACAITAGAAITCFDDGRGTPTTTVGDHIIGFAIGDADEDDLCPVLVNLGYHPGTS